ncbi:hypothetical protein [Streptomyces sp. N35]|uniref:hypothetical protein n=1 Tax=Streptomyces sp. N35 TaxID=2795730 RepID=UPI0018F45B13|nr:hypothetical protein [Streptomyces sp. N35]
MNLGELITALEAADPTVTVRRGFTNPHSYRGDYMELAFEPTANVSVGAMLADARSALGATFQGYKGGDFEMREYTWCWLSEYGDASNETISPLALEAMLADTVQPAAATSAPADPGLRDRIARVIHRTVHPESDWGQQVRFGMHQQYLNVADAVLAVFPAPADRAAVLREALAAAEAINARFPFGCSGTTVVEELRRLADEAQQTEDQCVCGHLIDQHFEDVCQVGDCPCQDALTPEGAIGRAARDRRWKRERIRCGHVDIVYGRCTRYMDDHDDECVHENQPAT